MTDEDMVSREVATRWVGTDPETSIKGAGWLVAAEQAGTTQTTPEVTQKPEAEGVEQRCIILRRYLNTIVPGFNDHYAAIKELRESSKLNGTLAIFTSDYRRKHPELTNYENLFYAVEILDQLETDSKLELTLPPNQQDELLDKNEASSITEPRVLALLSPKSLEHLIKIVEENGIDKEGKIIHALPNAQRSGQILMAIPKVIELRESQSLSDSENYTETLIDVLASALTTMPDLLVYLPQNLRVAIFRKMNVELLNVSNSIHQRHNIISPPNSQERTIADTWVKKILSKLFLIEKSIYDASMAQRYSEQELSSISEASHTRVVESLLKSLKTVLAENTFETNQAITFELINYLATILKLKNSLTDERIDEVSYLLDQAPTIFGEKKPGEENSEKSEVLQVISYDRLTLLEAVLNKKNGRRSKNEATSYSNESFPLEIANGHLLAESILSIIPDAEHTKNFIRLNVMPSTFDEKKGSETIEVETAVDLFENPGELLELSPHKAERELTTMLDIVKNGKNERSLDIMALLKGDYQRVTNLVLDFADPIPNPETATIIPIPLEVTENKEEAKKRLIALWYFLTLYTPDTSVFLELENAMKAQLAVFENTADEHKTIDLDPLPSDSIKEDEFVAQAGD